MNVEVVDVEEEEEEAEEEEEEEDPKTEDPDDPVEIEAVVPRGPEQHLLTVRDGGRWDAVRFNRALEALALQPQVGVLFVAPGLYHGRSEGFELERELANSYGPQFADSLIAVGCNESLLEEGRSLSCNGPRGNANGALGLFLSLFKDTRLRVAHDDADVHRYTDDVYADVLPDFVPGMLEELEFQDEDPTLAVVVFASSLPPVDRAARTLLKALKKRYDEQQFSVWGSFTNDDIWVAKKVEGQMVTYESCLVVIRLSGDGSRTRQAEDFPDLRTWSAVIKCTKSKREVDEQISSFRRSLMLRQSSILLLAGPTTTTLSPKEDRDSVYKNCSEFRDAIKQYFPETPLIGTFANRSSCIGNNGASEANQYFLHNNSMSLMVISYD